MASLYRPKVVEYYTPEGRRCNKEAPGAVAKPRTVKTWYGKYTDGEGKERRESLGTTKKEVAFRKLAKAGRTGQAGTGGHHQRGRNGTPEAAGA